MACQSVHLQRYKATGGHVIDPTHNEKAAVLAVLPILGDYVAGIGMDKPVLGELLIFYTLSPQGNLNNPRQNVFQL